MDRWKWSRRRTVLCGPNPLSNSVLASRKACFRFYVIKLPHFFSATLCFVTCSYTFQYIVVAVNSLAAGRAEPHFGLSDLPYQIKLSSVSHQSVIKVGLFALFQSQTFNTNRILHLDSDCPFSKS